MEALYWVAGVYLYLCVGATLVHSWEISIIVGGGRRPGSVRRVVETVGWPIGFLLAPVAMAMSIVITEIEKCGRN